MEQSKDIWGVGDLYPATAAIPLCRSLFGFTPDEQEVIEMLVDVFDFTGNATAMEQTLWEVQVEDHHAHLCIPPGAVRMVQRSHGTPLIGTAEKASAIITFGHIQKRNPYLSEDSLVGSPASQFIEMESLMEAYKAAGFATEKPKGEYVVWNVDGQDGLVLPHLREGYIDVTYHDMLMDCDGIPLINKPVMRALCYYLNFIKVRMRFYAGLAPKYVLDVATQEKDQKINQAKMGTGITDQGMSAILTTLVSHGRHRYGRTFRT